MADETTEQDAEKDRLRKECGAWLKAQREAAGLTQKELGDLVDLKNLNFISQIENGRRRIPFEHYGIWAQALRLDAREFVGTLLSYYEPVTYEIIFKDRRRNGAKSV